MRDNFLIVGLMLGGVIAWLWFNKSRPNGTACRAADKNGNGGSSSDSPSPLLTTALGLGLNCGPIGGHWRPQNVTQEPGQPPTGF